jgi:hypothetical protein
MLWSHQTLHRVAAVELCSVELCTADLCSDVIDIQIYMWYACAAATTAAAAVVYHHSENGLCWHGSGGCQWMATGSPAAVPFCRKGCGLRVERVLLGIKQLHPLLGVRWPCLGHLRSSWCC